jgi:hypothetical protein
MIADGHYENESDIVRDALRRLKAARIESGFIGCEFSSHFSWSDMDIEALVMRVIRERYLSSQENLKAYAKKVRAAARKLRVCLYSVEKSGVVAKESKLSRDELVTLLVWLTRE